MTEWLVNGPGAMAPLHETMLLQEALAFIDDLDLEGGIDGDDSDGLNELLGLPVACSTANNSSSEATCVDLEYSFDPIGPSGPENVDGLKQPQSRKTLTSNRSRTRRREEVIYLRSMVKELEERLQTMRARASEQQAAAERAKQNTEDRSPIITAWEQVASRQNEERQKSEIENLKLRRMLQDQIQVGKSLERLLMRKREGEDQVRRFRVKKGYCSGRHVCLFQFATAQDNKAKRHRRSGSSLSSAWSNAEIYDELIKTLDELIVEMPRVISIHNSFTQHKQRKVEILPHPDSGMWLQTLDNQILPFGYEATCEEIWNSLPEIMSEDNIRHISDVDSDGEMVKMRFSLTVEVGAFTGGFNVKTVGRRYTQQQRTIIVTTAFLDPSEIAGVKMDGIYMKYHSWYVIEPLAGESIRNSATGEATRVFSYTYGVPEVITSVADQLQKVGTLSNFLMSAMAAEFDVRHHILADRLMQRTINISSLRNQCSHFYM